MRSIFKLNSSMFIHNINNPSKTLKPTNVTQQMESLHKT